MPVHHRFAAPALALTIAALSGCGGGGGSTPASYSLEGFAAKGTLQHAIVEVYTIDATGKESEKPVKTGETTETGTYKIADVGTTAGQQYIVKIKPKADGSTVHVDEIVGEQRLPDNFVLTALAKTDSNTTTVGVTPFSHMVVEAAKKTDGGLTSTNIAKSQTTITELLGFNPASVTTNDGKTEDEKKQKLMLTAVAQMAKDGALGCGSAADAGAKTQCVTAALAASASTSSLKLTTKDKDDRTVDVSSAFAAAVKTTIAQDPTQSSATVTQALAKLECAANCTPAVPVDNTASTAIAKVKAVVNEIRTDLTTMFSKDGATSTSKGKVNAQAFLFKQAMDNVQLNVDQAAKDLNAVTLGIQLYTDYKSGKTTSNGQGTAYGQLAYSSNLGAYAVSAVGCTLYKDDPSQTPTPTASTNTNEANFIGCSARYSRTAQYDASTNKTTYVDYRHGFNLTPGTVAGSYTYKTKASTQTWSCTGQWWQNNSGMNGTSSAQTYPCSVKTVNNLQLDANHAAIIYEGTVTVADSDADGNFTSINLTGDIAPGFSLTGGCTTGTTSSASGCTTSVALIRATGKDQWKLNAKVTKNANGDASKVTMAGQLASLDGSGTKLTEISLKDGSYVDKAAATAQLDLSFSSFTNTNTAVLSGSLTAETPVSDKSGTQKLPSHIVFKGGLTNNLSTGAVEFLAGSAEVALLNYNNFDATKPASASNTATLNFTFKGSVTAPSQPRLELVFNTSGNAYDVENTATSAGLTYNRWTGSTNTRAVNLSISRTLATATNAPSKTASVTESTSGLSIAIAEGAKTADVKANGNTIGSLDLDKGLITFTDGSIVSLDIKL
jgi:hypothetical protein